MDTLTGEAAASFLRMHAVRLSSGAALVGILLFLFLGVDATQQGVLFVLLAPLLVGVAVSAISADGMTDWINNWEQTFRSKRDKAREKEGKFARFFRRPFWGGSLKLWTATDGLSSAHVRAGLRMAVALYFWAVMIFLLAITAYITVAIVVLIFMVAIAYKIYEFSQTGGRTTVRYDNSGRTLGTSRQTTDWLGKPKTETFDASGKKVGESKPTQDWLGRPKVEHFDDKGAKTGESKPTEDWLGRPKTEHFDEAGHKTGESRPTEDWLGRPKVEHFDERGAKAGETKPS